MTEKRSLQATRLAEKRTWRGVALYVVAAMLAAWQYTGPAANEKPPEEPSGRRAVSNLGLLLGEGEPSHPAGSIENENFRTRLLDQLNELALEAKVIPLSEQFGGKTQMANILIRSPGKKAARPIVLATHYDSCLWGPGAGDAGQCVAAVMETLQSLSHAPLEHEFWVLLTDHEERGPNEGGLQGAADFLKRRDFPWGDTVPLIINFDARGNRGAALLYETHRNNYGAMRVAAANIASPRVTTSLMVNVYDHLPNKTDFTLFREAGWCGWNFAVIGGTEHYHQPSDSLINLSPRSVEHFSMHAERMLRALNKMEDASLQQIDASQPAVFFDLIGTFVIIYPAWGNWLQAGVVLFLLIAACMRSRASPLRARMIVCTIGMIVLCVITSAACGWLISTIFARTGWVPRRFVRGGDMICLIYPAIAMVLNMELGRRLPRQITRKETTIALAFTALAAGAATAWALPGGAYLFLWPATFLALWSNYEIAVINNSRSRFVVLNAAVWNAVVPAVLCAPTYVLLAQALGPLSGLVLAGVVSAMLLPTLLAWPEVDVAPMNVPVQMTTASQGG
ncbi:MAG: M28 family peptidase [Pirellulales bacterium]